MSKCKHSFIESDVEKTYCEFCGDTQEVIELKGENARLREALEKIRSTNGLQYSNIFNICDEALQSGAESVANDPKEE